MASGACSLTDFNGAGEVDGGFYGPNAAEAGRVLQAVSSNDRALLGCFVGKRE